MSGTGTPSTSVAGTIGAGSQLFYPGDTAVINLLAQVPAGGKTPPDEPTFSEDTAGVVTVSAGNWQGLPGTPGAFTLPVTILAVAPGTTIVRALEDGIDDSPASDIAVIVSARPSDTLAFDLTSVVISGG